MNFSTPTNPDRPLHQQSQTRRIKMILAFTAVSMAVSGCKTMVSYEPQVKEPTQTLRFAQGVGTLTQKTDTEEVFMYPTFRIQGPADPTFTIGYANNSATAVNFDVSNVKAFFRGQPVAIYTYTEKAAQIESEKRGQQIALAIAGGLAAGAAAYGASRRTYTSNYSGVVSNGYRTAAFSGYNTVRVYDPVSGILAGAAVGGATAVGINQIEYNAQSKQEAALSILQANTVDPLQMVSGALILKGCCDQFARKDDVVRFEVTVSGKTSVFEFNRAISTQ